jgi:gliding motility-associated-like protein
MRKLAIVLLYITISLTSFGQINLANGLINHASLNSNTNTLSCNNWLNTPSHPSAAIVGDLDIPGTSITLEATFIRTAPYSGGFNWAGDLISKHTSPADANYLLRPNNAEITTTNGFFTTPPICEIELNKVYHVAMTYDGNILKFYRNGFLMSSVPATGSLFQNNLLTKIGLYDGLALNTNLIGFINEVRIWNVVRSQLQIQTYMNSSLPNPTTQTGLLAYYTFDNLLNKQGNATWNATLQGPATINQTNPNCTFVADSCNIVAPIVPDFTIPDTVCVNTPVNIQNNTVGATSHYWNFCSGGINQIPTGTNLGNFGGVFSSPAYMDYVFENNNYYGFVVNFAPGKLIRLDFGNSLFNTPTTVDLGNIGGVIPSISEGIQVIKNEGKWYAIIVAGYLPVGVAPRILKIDFGANITNTSPVGTNWGNLGNLDNPHELHVFQAGSSWYGLTVNAQNNTITRFNFTSSFDNVPTGTNLGNVGILSYPTGIHAINDNGNWRVFIVNGGNNSRTNGTFSLSRLDFGNSLLNIPIGVNLGNPGNFLKHPRDFTILKQCGQIIGYAINALIGSYEIVKMDFNNDLTSIPIMMSIGNIGNLNFPHSISKIVRVNSDLFSFITNVDNGTLTRLQFSGCSNSSIPNHTGPNPPPITYNTPGIYNINLSIDDGLATQASVCKQIVVINCITDSTIINDYTPVSSLDVCKNVINVEDASAFNIGDTVLIIQMKGAVIDSSNTISFGFVTNYRNAGNYEFNYVKSKNGNSIELLYKIIRQYDLPNGKVQLIRVPYFQNYTATNSLTCLPWDGNKGGVLVFNVADKLELNANIDLTARGFRGGQYNMNSNYNCNVDSFYIRNNNGINGANKGESIFLNNTLQAGRGSLASGGGGGNSTNAGGGGGANGGVGGSGGKQYVGTLCNTNFTNGGLGGINLAYSNALNKIFLGGGGGAGHGNEVNLGSGGNGGGIVIISANRIQTNGFSINSKGAAPVVIPISPNDDGRSGGGGGGTILLNYQTLLDNTNVSVTGGKGDDCTVASAGAFHGTGGGGGGGIVWVSKPTIETGLTPVLNGGTNGVNINLGNNAWGASPGQRGDTLKNLSLPIATVLFKPNIDSVKIKDSIMGCSSFDFKGLGYTNTSPITSWQWYFGDGGTANTQNTNHSFTTSGTFPVKLVVTDINGCKDSITKNVTASLLDVDFSYTQNICNPLSVQFSPLGTLWSNPLWLFGDGNNSTNPSPAHTYNATGTYPVKYVVSNGICTDTINKNITVNIIYEDIVLTPDTILCLGTTKRLRTMPALNFCWTPSTYLNDVTLREPTTSTPQTITYYYTAQVTGTNIITNGNFSAGNTGFTSAYNYATPNVTEGQYFVGPNPQAWNGSLSNCPDHTTGNGNMMLVNGSPTPNVNVWRQTVTVTPNTNYAFSTWIQALWPPNPAQLQFSINGRSIGNTITASLPTCTWTQFFTTWNSGNSTTANISIVNVNTQIQGNDFALDDISFAPVFIKRDSVKISVDSPYVRTNNDTTICEGRNVQLNTVGAQTYSWTPATGLSNSNIANPTATPTSAAQYIVTGTNANGCIAKDTINIAVNAKPSVTTSNDTSICRNTSVQLFANGGNNYLWSPPATLNNSSIANPVASPASNTTYYVSVTDNNNCSNTDSIKVDIISAAQFSVGSAQTICLNETVQLNASGGDIYSWSPASSLNNPSAANPIASPQVSTNYTVTITETTCNESANLFVAVTVNSLPVINATKSNDIDCSKNTSQLNASGAVQYSWSPVATLNNPLSANPVASPVANTQYIVTGTDANGCSDTSSVTVVVNFSGTGLYFMPSAFTPNNDGVNDCFGIKYWGAILELEFSIFNRWGERVFYTNNPADCWNGQWKGVEQKTDVYVYWIKAKTTCEPSVFRKGVITLIR